MYILKMIFILQKSLIKKWYTGNKFIIDLNIFIYENLLLIQIFFCKWYENKHNICIRGKCIIYPKIVNGKNYIIDLNIFYIRKFTIDSDIFVNYIWKKLYAGNKFVIDLNIIIYKNLLLIWIILYTIPEQK